MYGGGRAPPARPPPRGPPPTAPSRAPPAAPSRAPARAPPSAPARAPPAAPSRAPARAPPSAPARGPPAAPSRAPAPASRAPPAAPASRAPPAAPASRAPPAAPRAAPAAPGRAPAPASRGPPAAPGRAPAPASRGPPAAPRAAPAAAPARGRAAAPPAKSSAREESPELDQTFHKGVVKGAVEDMTLLPTLSNEAIVKNLSERYFQDEIYTYIGRVLVSVNPFKRMYNVGPETIAKYRGAGQHDLPPHVYHIADYSYRQMVDARDPQCIIISGESGAGKTEASKLIMNHLAAISGGGAGVDNVKRIILESNPLLEAFGNAKTLRNNNSSRFGKYFEILFNLAGQPQGGVVTNFLLEKSRITNQLVGERNFHCFYQLLAGATPEEKEAYGLTSPQDFLYLSKSQCFEVDNMDDVKEWKDTLQAMNVCGIDGESQQEIMRILGAILYLGNIQFQEGANDQAVPIDPYPLEMAAYLLGVDATTLTQKLTSRLMETGGRRGSVYDVPLNVVQATAARDSLSKSTYSRVFDYLVASVNKSIEIKNQPLSIGVLDIYGFEIFGEDNGFEQFCINYVNEKLQQIFIELTIKSEQEDYLSEGIQWTPIKFFDNKIVCDLIESKRPPGMIAVLNDVCKTMHAEGTGVDYKYMEKLQMAISNPHYIPRGKKFMIKHYAGDVTYCCEGFSDKNKDVLFKDLIQLMQSSNMKLLVDVYPDKFEQSRTPTTAGHKIVAQAQDLVKRLMACNPSYVRCIKPNENKAAHDYDIQRCTHQVKYLGLLENIRVRRAGFAYRGEFSRFVNRYLVCHDSMRGYRGNPKEGCKRLLEAVGVDPNEWTMGKTKIFLKSPETLFGMDELRERVLNHYAGRIQRVWKRRGGAGLRMWKEQCQFWDNMVAAFGDCYNDPYWGLYAEWPEYQEHLVPHVEYCYKIFLNWRAYMTVMSLTPDEQLAMRQKIVSYDIFAGNKNWPCGRTYRGDYLADHTNETSANYQAVARSVINPGENIYYSSLVQKINSRLVSDKRGFVVTDRNMYKLDPKNYKVKKLPVPLSSVIRISVSTEDDTFVVVHCKAPERDLVIDVGFQGENTVSELVTLLKQMCPSDIEIDFSNNIRFNTSRTQKKLGKTISCSVGRLTDPKVTANCILKKGPQNTAQILYR